MEAERTADHEAATLTNFHFHFLIYRSSQMSDLVAILGSLDFVMGECDR